MKVVHICQFLGVGGLEKVLFLLIKEQIKAGHDIELIVYDYEQTWVPKFKILGIKVHCNKIKNTGYDYSLISYFKNILDCADIVHTHDLNPVLYVGPLKILQKLKFKKFPKFIHTTHGMEHIDLAPKTRLYENFLSLVVDRIVAVSPAFKEYYLAKTFAAKDRVFNIDNGSDIEKNFPEISSLSFKEKVCKIHNISINQELWIILARVFPLKDQKIVSDVMERYPHATLLICGPSSDKEYLNSILTSKPDNVVLTGAIEDVDLYLKASSLFISASHHEGIPISVLEAAANGVPCVLSDIAGHRTLYKDENFFIFEAKNSKSLVECLDSITPEKKIRKSKKLHKTVYDLYSSHRMFKDYEDVYTK